MGGLKDPGELEEMEDDERRQGEGVVEQPESGGVWWRSREDRHQGHEQEVQPRTAGHIVSHLYVNGLIIHIQYLMQKHNPYISISQEII